MISFLRQAIHTFAEISLLNRWFTRKKHFFRKRLNFSIPTQKDVLISPAECLVEKVAVIDEDFLIEDKTISARQRFFKLQEVVKSKADLSPFIRGYYLKLYLAPHNLHNIIFPIDAVVGWYNYIPGRWLPIAIYKKAVLLNERLVAWLDTDFHFPVILIMIASFLVGGIKKSFKPSNHYQKGDLFGCFTYGSTVILILPSQKFEFQISEGQKLLLGQPIAKIKLS